MSTWGMAVVRDFRTAARAAPLAADERPVAVAPHGQPAAVAHGRPAAVAPHEQLGEAGEPMVAAGHGRPAPLGKARERSRAPLWEPPALWKED